MPSDRPNIAWTAAAALLLAGAWSGFQPDAGNSLALPPPMLKGVLSLEEVLAGRRSARQFSDRPLTPQQIGQLCWAGQGITDLARGYRTAPSAGALYPVSLYVVTASGVDRYDPERHRLVRQLSADVRPALSRAALGQESVRVAPACLAITAVVERTARKYGERAERYCLLEAGHIAQNILLQATSLGLAGVPVGAFDDQQVAAVLRLPAGQHVLYLLPIGWPATRDDHSTATTRPTAGTVSE